MGGGRHASGRRPRAALPAEPVAGMRTPQCDELLGDPSVVIDVSNSRDRFNNARMPQRPGLYFEFRLPYLANGERSPATAQNRTSGRLVQRVLGCPPILLPFLRVARCVQQQLEKCQIQPSTELVTDLVNATRVYKPQTSMQVEAWKVVLDDPSNDVVHLVAAGFRHHFIDQRSADATTARRGRDINGMLDGVLVRGPRTKWSVGCESDDLGVVHSDHNWTVR